MASKQFQPFVPAETQMKEFTFKALLMGSIFGILFGASTVYLALKAGLTVSASIPIAVLAITLGRRLFKTTILENNIIQTTGSASESIAAGSRLHLTGISFPVHGRSRKLFQLRCHLYPGHFRWDAGNVADDPLAPVADRQGT